MPISEKQAADNQRLHAAAMADKVTARVTGKYLKWDADNAEWISGGDTVEHNRHKKIRWGWQGYTYGPDEKGVMRQITGRKAKEKRSEPTVLTFGELLPRAAFDHHNALMFKGENIQDRFEVVLEGEEGGQGEEPLESMTKVQIYEKGVSLGMEPSELDGLNKADLIEAVQAKMDAGN